MPFLKINRQNEDPRQGPQHSVLPAMNFTVLYRVNRFAIFCSCSTNRDRKLVLLYSIEVYGSEILFLLL